MAARRQRLLGIRHAHKGRQPRTQQRQRQPRGRLVGVEPDHEPPQYARQHRARAHACGKTQPFAAGVDASGIARQRRAQHHAFGPEVDDPRLFIDEQAQARQRQHRARAEHRSQQ